VKRPIYLDHHATTPVDPRVLDAMLPYFREEFGNASSATHAYGWRAEAAVDLAREQIAAVIGAADPREIVFTSGTTESDNLALLGVARASRKAAPHLITTAIEHPAVLDAARAVERGGGRLSLLPVDEVGRVAAEALSAACSDDTVLVSIGAANSEIGTLQPLEALSAACHERGVPFHSDAAQAVGKVPIDVRAQGIDLLSFCAHKLYGPKGIGALYVRSGRPRLRVEPLLYGGGHEGGLRSGTLPVALCVGFARALELCVEELEKESERLAGLRDRLFDRLCAALPGVLCNGPLDGRLPGNLNVSFEGVKADALLPRLPELALSTGSACSSGSGKPSHVLAALGYDEARMRGALRVGLGRGTTEAEIEVASRRLIEEVEAARNPGSSATLGRRSMNPRKEHES
jgi:cysteine desulfurase